MRRGARVLRPVRGSEVLVREDPSGGQRVQERARADDPGRFVGDARLQGEPQPLHRRRPAHLRDCRRQGEDALRRARVRRGQDHRPRRRRGRRRPVPSQGVRSQPRARVGPRRGS